MTYRRHSARDRAKQWVLFNMIYPPQVTHSNIGTSYSERVTNTYRTIVDFGRIPADQIRLIAVALSDDGTADMEVYDVTNSQQLAEVTDFNAGATELLDSGWQALPANVIGTEITIAIRVKGAAAGTDITIERIYVLARRS